MNNKTMIEALRGPILILGGAGFIGANLFLELQRYRSDVFAVVRRRGLWRLQGVMEDRILEVDITDRTASKHLIDTVKPETIFDCIAYGGYSFEENSRIVHKTNFTSLVDFVEMLSEHHFSAYIHAGSSSEYGLNCAGPLEDAPLQPNGHYAISKAAMSNYIYFCGVIKKLPIISLRLYSIYGPLEDTSRLLPNLIIHSLKKEYPPLVNPEISRDFLYITDACTAFIQAAVRLHPECMDNHTILVQVKRQQ